MLALRASWFPMSGGASRRLQPSAKGRRLLHLELRRAHCENRENLVHPRTEPASTPGTSGTL